MRAAATAGVLVHTVPTPSPPADRRETRRHAAISSQREVASSASSARPMRPAILRRAPFSTACTGASGATGRRTTAGSPAGICHTGSVWATGTLWEKTRTRSRGQIRNPGASRITCRCIRREADRGGRDGDTRHLQTACGPLGSSYVRHRHQRPAQATRNCTDIIDVRHPSSPERSVSRHSAGDPERAAAQTPRKLHLPPRLLVQRARKE